MQRVVNAICLLDVVLLLAVKWCVDLLVEWLGLAQRRLELGLVGVYVASSIARDAVGPFPLGVGVAITLLGALALTLRHRRSARGRAQQLASPAEIVGRIILVAVSVVCVAAVLSMRVGWEARDWFFVSVQTSYLLAIFVTALPGDDSRRGRKAKAAAAKIVDSFGRVWVPEPQGVGA
jgi:hypothetical protein